MKKYLILSVILFALSLYLCLFSSCSYTNGLHSDSTNEDNESVDKYDKGTIEDNNNPEIFTYQEAYDLFKEVYSWGTHADYIEYVDNEANKMKNEV